MTEKCSEKYKYTAITCTKCNQNKLNSEVGNLRGER